MKQTKPVKAPQSAPINELTRQDLRAFSGGTDGAIIVENLLGISGGGVVAQGIGGTGFLPDD